MLAGGASAACSKQGSRTVVRSVVGVGISTEVSPVKAREKGKGVLLQKNEMLEAATFKTKRNA
jgi:hypothetical protein